MILGGYHWVSIERYWAVRGIIFENFIVGSFVCFCWEICLFCWEICLFLLEDLFLFVGRFVSFCQNICLFLMAALSVFVGSFFIFPLYLFKTVLLL